MILSFDELMQLLLTSKIEYFGWNGVVYQRSKRLFWLLSARSFYAPSGQKLSFRIV